MPCLFTLNKYDRRCISPPSSDKWYHRNTSWARKRWWTHSVQSHCHGDLHIFPILFHLRALKPASQAQTYGYWCANGTGRQTVKILLNSHNHRISCMQFSYCMCIMAHSQHVQWTVERAIPFIPCGRPSSLPHCQERCGYIEGKAILVGDLEVYLWYNKANLNCTVSMLEWPSRTEKSFLVWYHMAS